VASASVTTNMAHTMGGRSGSDKPGNSQSPTMSAEEWGPGRGLKSCRSHSTFDDLRREMHRRKRLQLLTGRDAPG
jgi:hypothetical protein